MMLLPRSVDLPLWALVSALMCWMNLTAPTLRAQPQTPPENPVFDAAAKAFQDGIYDRAEREFAEFTRKYPDSPRLPEAILLQARAALNQQRLGVATALLSTNLSRAGALEEDFHYWLAKTQLESTDYQAAAETFALIIRQYTNSLHLLEASYGEALARFKLRQWDQVVPLLTRPDGTFQQAARSRGNDELVARGVLLLGEALLQQGQYAPAEAAVQRMAERDLTPEFKWRREYLLCRIQMADRRPQAVLENVTNLLATAAATGQPLLLAESVALHASILEQLGLWTAAAQVYEQSLGESAPAERRRHARLKIIDLLLAQDKLAEATQKLESFLAQPDDKSLDLALLTLGELHLRQHMAGLATNRAEGPVAGSTTPAATNHLQVALAQFEKLLTDFPRSPWLGKAQLDKGWCLWADSKNREAQTCFRSATEQLPWSVDQAVARFKLADTQFRLKDYTNALQTYRGLFKDYTNLPLVRDALFVPAAYQILHLSLELGNLAEATGALERILAADTANQFADRGLLLLGEKLTSAGYTAPARVLFARFTERFGDESPLRPQVELAIARSYVQEKNWPAALAQYERWLATFEGHALRPQAEFNYARANYLARRSTNAFNLFTNFVARYPTHELAPWAQYWVADYYYAQKDSVALRNAEKWYQDLFLKTNWAGSPLTFQARMMAGRAAFARQAFGEAESYFTDLVNITDPACPRELQAEALFALGDTLLREAADRNQPLKKFSEAREAFAKIPQLYPESPLVPPAWGRIGDCCLQSAAQDPKDSKLYDSAAEAYQRVLRAAAADVNSRSQAEVGLALVSERQAQLLPAPANESLWKTARDHYLNVLYGNLLREGEKPSLFWQKEAGNAAARLAETRKDWEVAVNIYNRLIQLLPPLRPTLEKKLEKAREQLRLESD